ncbi:hypothetical protein GLAREA_04885 [Glarea lozoyensis ATCC 20868]|uniref:2EXR domain-containing protein n=1 Tax=Glarea lozoyensis (strain ATCC 20868 / MF5171) TaxID=1116229 RepID=S3CSP3_GLAL2|nr:uncharacterized protein GLAREA_04885 [Glarea lozoyensis ATCC 20868]EPE28094.1 hypothetical protein GLAREA_04885 [Glarea lozoyensis ATCC 20868]
MVDSWSTASTSSADSALPVQDAQTLTSLNLLRELPLEFPEWDLSTVLTTKINSTFTCFSRLPLELRLAIWEKTVQPRIVLIEEDTSGDRNTAFRSRTSLPVALSACKESRNATLPSYPLCFGSVWYPPTIRFNLSLDTLFIAQPGDLSKLFGIMRDKELDSIRHIAFSGQHALFLDAPSYRQGFQRAFKSLSSLRELLIVYFIHDHDEQYCQALSGTRIYDDLPKDEYIHNRGTLLRRFKEDDWEFAMSEAYSCRRVYGKGSCDCAYGGGLRAANQSITDSVISDDDMVDNMVDGMIADMEDDMQAYGPIYSHDWTSNYLLQLAYDGDDGDDYGF